MRPIYIAILLFNNICILKIPYNDNFRPILQFVAIKRGDTGEWALPGGMVDPGEKVGVTAVREFQEEAMNSLSATDGFNICFLHIKA